MLEAVDDGASRRQPLRVGFTHGADEEDLVVHGEPVEDAGDHDRQKAEQGSTGVQTYQSDEPTPADLKAFQEGKPAAVAVPPRCSFGRLRGRVVRASLGHRRLTVTSRSAEQLGGEYGGLGAPF
jgi:hypothetical protein